MAVDNSVPLDPIAAFYRLKHQQAVDELALANSRLVQAGETIRGMQGHVKQLEDELVEARKPKRKPRKKPEESEPGAE